MKFRMATPEEMEYFEYYISKANEMEWGWKKNPALRIPGKLEPPKVVQEQEEVSYLPPKHVVLKMHLLQFPDSYFYYCLCFNNMILDYKKKV